MTVMRIAFFGGSFDPPHRGHLAIARAAMERLALDQVWMAPAGTQPLKLHTAASSYEDRLAMVTLAVAGCEGIIASNADAPRVDGRPNYTLDVVEEIRMRMTREDTLFLLSGADSFFSLQQWHRAAELMFCCDWIVAGRPEFPLEDVAAVLPVGVRAERIPGAEVLPGLVQWELRNEAQMTSRLYLLPDLRERVSATEIRAVLAGERSADGVLSPAVLRYIESRGLYR